MRHPSWEEAWATEVNTRRVAASIEAVHRACIELEALLLAKRIRKEDYRGSIKGVCEALADDIGVMLPDGLPEAVKLRNGFAHGIGVDPEQVEAAISCFHNVMIALHEPSDPPRPEPAERNKLQEELRLGINLRSFVGVATRWEHYRRNHDKGSVVDGKVLKLFDHAALIELEFGVRGRVDISEISYFSTKHPEERLREHQDVRVRILEYVEHSHRIILSIKQTLPDPWDQIEMIEGTGRLLRGLVHDWIGQGLLVEVEGVIGMVEHEEMSLRPNPRSADLPSRGSVVEVRLLRVLSVRRQVFLSIRDAQWQRFCEQHPVGTVLVSHIVRMSSREISVQTAHGLLIDVPADEVRWLGAPRILETHTIGQEVEVAITSGTENGTRTIGRDHKLQGSIRLAAPRPEDTHPLGRAASVSVASIRDGRCVEVLTDDGIEGVIPWRELSFPDDWNEPNGQLLGTMVSVSISGHLERARRLEFSERRYYGLRPLPANVTLLSSMERRRAAEEARKKGEAEQAEREAIECQRLQDADRGVSILRRVMFGCALMFGGVVFATQPELHDRYTGKVPFPIFWFSAVLCCGATLSFPFTFVIRRSAMLPREARMAMAVVAVIVLYVYGGVTHAYGDLITYVIGSWAHALGWEIYDAIQGANSITHSVARSGHPMTASQFVDGFVALFIFAPVAKLTYFILRFQEELCHFEFHGVALFVPVYVMGLGAYSLGRAFRAPPR